MLNAAKTKNILFCKSMLTPGVTCKYGKKCGFAHSISKVNPPKCKYEQTEEGCLCKWKEGRKCWNIHINETKQDYAERLGFLNRTLLCATPSTPAHHGIDGLSALKYASMIVNKLAKFEPIDVETNVGAMIMKKWGWNPKNGLGKDEQGILSVPLPVVFTKNQLKHANEKKGLFTPIVFVRETKEILDISKLSI